MVRQPVAARRAAAATCMGALLPLTQRSRRSPAAPDGHRSGHARASLRSDDRPAHQRDACVELPASRSRGAGPARRERTHRLRHAHHPARRPGAGRTAGGGCRRPMARCARRRRLVRGQPRRCDGPLDQRSLAFHDAQGAGARWPAAVDRVLSQRQLGRGSSAYPPASASTSSRATTPSRPGRI